MPTQASFNRVLVEINTANNYLVAGTNLYFAPAVLWFEGMSAYEVQVIDGGSSHRDFDGGIDPEDFNLQIAYFRRIRVDHGLKSHKALSNATIAFRADIKTIRDALDGSFLNGTIHRPLRCTNESAVQQNRKYPGVFLKILTFRGTYNESR